MAERFRKLDEHPAFNASYKVLGMLAAILAIMAACIGGGVTLYRHIRSSQPAGSPARQPRSQLPASTTTSSRSQVTSTASPQVGDCLGADTKVVACDSTHVYEVFRAGPTCQAINLLEYLGGTPGVDVLSTEIRITAISSPRSLCLLQAPPKVPQTGSAQRIPDTPDGDAWRRCSDDRFGGRTVSCSDDHTTEVVYLGTLKSHEALNCPGRAAAYLDADISARLDEIEIISTRIGTESACLVRARGENHFTGSLRRLGTEALPLAPD